MRASDYSELHKMLLTLYTPEQAHEWLRSPHPQLEGIRPVDSSYYKVRAVIDRLESGAFL